MNSFPPAAIVAQMTSGVISTRALAITGAARAKLDCAARLTVGLPTVEPFNRDTRGLVMGYSDELAPQRM